jgi:hypothetical protein
MPTELDLRAGEPDPEMTALDQGITSTASVKVAAAIGRSLAMKIANPYPPQYEQQQQYEPQYEQEPQQQYVNAVQAPEAGTLGAVGQHLRGAAGGLGTVLGETALAGGHALLAAGKGIGSVANRVAGHARNYMETDTPGGRRWGTGATPAAFTNEYGQPVYG